MKAQEAILTLRRCRIGDVPDEEFESAFEMAIEALEKQIPMKPITYAGTNRADCPKCGSTVRGIKEPFGDNCSKCGQKLDFGG